jgi:GT2 family glycosyltransferase
MSPMLALGRTRLPYLPFADGANASFRRCLFDEIGGFEESFVKGADVEICVRMFVLTPHAIVFDPGAVVWEPGEPTLRALLHQRYRMGIGANLMRMKFPALYERAGERKGVRQAYWSLRAATLGGLRLVRLNLAALVGRNRDAAIDADIRLLMAIAQRLGAIHGRRWLEREGVRPAPIDGARLRVFTANAAAVGSRVVRL